MAISEKNGQVPRNSCPARKRFAPAPLSNDGHVWNAQCVLIILRKLIHLKLAELVVHGDIPHATTLYSPTRS